MHMRTIAVAAIACALGLVGGAVWAQGGTHGSRSYEWQVGLPPVQVPDREAGGQVEEQEAPPHQVWREGAPYGPVISGEDIGFQVVMSRSAQPDQVFGRLMVRVNGEWYEAVAGAPAGRAVPAGVP